jgi:hypothetical protein
VLFKKIKNEHYSNISDPTIEIPTQYHSQLIYDEFGRHSEHYCYPVYAEPGTILIEFKRFNVRCATDEIYPRLHEK